MRKILLASLLLTMIAAAAWLLKSRKDEVAALATPEPPTTPVSIITPQTRTVTQSRIYLARVEAERHAEIAAKYAARIEAIPVEEGDAVKKGDRLVQLDANDVEQRIRELEGRVESLVQELEVYDKRYASSTRLYNAGAISEDAYDNARLLLAAKNIQLEEARTALQIQKQQLPYYTLTAPYDGIVGDVNAYLGGLASPGKALMTLYSETHVMRLRFPVASAVEPGNPVYLDDQEIGWIRAVHADAVDNLAEAEAVVNVSASPLRHGALLRVEVGEKRITGCSVPRDALYLREGRYRLMAYREGRFVADDVELLAEDGSYAVVSPCPEYPVAVAPQEALYRLPLLEHPRVTERL